MTGTPAKKLKKAALLFAGLFATRNNERGQVMNGIERFGHGHEQLRNKIRAELTALRAQQDAQPDQDITDPSQPKTVLDRLGEQVAWDTRAFDERRHTIGYACEVPATIERQLFTLPRTIQQSLERATFSGRDKNRRVRPSISRSSSAVLHCRETSWNPSKTIRPQCGRGHRSRAFERRGEGNDLSNNQ